MPEMYFARDFTGNEHSFDTPGWTPKKIVFGEAGNNTVKATRGLVALIKVVGAANVSLRDGGAEVEKAIWADINNTTEDWRNCPVVCGTSIVLVTGGACTVYILYR